MASWVLHIATNSGDKVNDAEKGGSCGTSGGVEIYKQGCVGEKLKESDKV